MDISIPEASSISDLKSCSRASAPSCPGAQPHSPELGQHMAMVREVWVLSLPCSGSSPGPSGCRWSLLSLEIGPALAATAMWVQACWGSGGPGVGVAQGLWGQQTGPRAAQGMREFCGRGQAGWGFPV